MQSGVACSAALKAWKLLGVCCCCYMQDCLTNTKLLEKDCCGEKGVRGEPALKMKKATRCNEVMSSIKKQEKGMNRDRLTERRPGREWAH